MKIGILQCGHLPKAITARWGDYDTLYPQLLNGHGFEFTPYFVVDGQFPDHIGATDGWLVTGSRHGAYEDHDWIPPLEDLIRQIRDAGQPLVGVCFGHQIIAQALGGRVEKFGGGWAIGATQYDLPEGRLTLNAWHQDQVTQRPPGAQVLASNGFCENAMLGYGDRIWSLQAHPEFEAGFLADLIRENRGGSAPDAVLDAAEARLAQPLDNAQIAAKIASVFKGAQS